MFAKLIKAVRGWAGDRKLYRSGVTFWTQRELTYREDGKVRELFREAFPGGGVEAETDLVKVIDRLYGEGHIAKLFGVILKPWPRLGIGRVWIFIASGFKKGITGETAILPMTNSQIARIVFHFFVRNAGWVGSYLNYANVSLSSSGKIQSGGMPMKSPFSISPETTLNKPSA